MARHSVVLSELEERLQHSEEMGLKARISASHVVKRIKDLLEKYYKPAATTTTSASAGKVTQKHMEQIQQELILIFDKLGDLDQPEVSLESSESAMSPPAAEGRRAGSPSPSHPPPQPRGRGASASGADPPKSQGRGEGEGGSESEKKLEELAGLSGKTTESGAALTEREALIFECTEYSIQSSEETEALSKVAQLEVRPAACGLTSFCRPPRASKATIPFGPF